MWGKKEEKMENNNICMKQNICSFFNDQADHNYPVHQILPKLQLAVLFIYLYFMYP